jgi:hypothetical protein
MADTSPEERCETTGNPCGSDTWQKDKGCRCWPCVRARVLAERERCERTANGAVFEALADTAPDHFDDEGRLDGYSFAAMVTIATKVVLAIRKDPRE